MRATAAGGDQLSIMVRSWTRAGKAVLEKVLCSRQSGAILERVYDEIPCRGMWFKTSAHISRETKARLFFEMYESAELRFVREYLRPDMDVVELGSGLGVVASQIGRQISPASRLICVEPSASLIELLRQNVARNAPGCRATFVNAAIAPSPVEELVFLQGSTHLTSRVAPRRGLPANSAHAVPATTLSTLLKEHGIGEFALVCDIEGSETAIVRTPGALERCTQLIIEVHDTVCEGKAWGEDELCQAIAEQHNMVLRDRYGPVCYFESPLTESVVKKVGAPTAPPNDAPERCP